MILEEAARLPLTQWESFYVIVGSSAGALTGLQFLVIALIAEGPLSRSMLEIRAFGTPTVVHFCAAVRLRDHQRAVARAPADRLRPGCQRLALVCRASAVSVRSAADSSDPARRASHAVSLRDRRHHAAAVVRAAFFFIRSERQ